MCRARVDPQESHVKSTCRCKITCSNGKIELIQHFCYNQKINYSKRLNEEVYYLDKEQEHWTNEDMVDSYTDVDLQYLKNDVTEQYMNKAILKYNKHV